MANLVQGYSVFTTETCRRKKGKGRKSTKGRKKKEEKKMNRIYEISRKEGKIRKYSRKGRIR
jgi:hypothetical protein